MSRPSARRLAALLLTLAVTVFAAKPALAYNGGAAAQYADKYCGTSPCGNYNLNWPSFAWGGDDCTNFVSQALYNGGIAMRTTGNPIPWAMEKINGTWNWVNSWTVADDGTSQNNETFIVDDLGAYNTLIEAGPRPYARGLPSYANQGDVAYYNWDDNKDTLDDHMSIFVTTDGQWVDTHTTDHYHAYWTLADNNAQWATTTIAVYHIPSSAH